MNLESTVSSPEAGVPENEQRGRVGGSGAGFPAPLALVTVFLMAYQVSLHAKVPVTPADVLLGLALLGILWGLWRERGRLAAPWPILVFLVVLEAAALGARSALPGAIEAVQRVEQFFAGYLLFQWLLRKQPGRLAVAVTAGLAVNVAAALVQGMSAGFGPGMHGLFRSRMALSFFLTVAGAWCLPVWISWARGGLLRAAAVAAGVAVTLACIPHGQMLLGAMVVWVIAGLLHSRRGALLALAGVGLFGVSLWLGPAAGVRRSVLAASMSPFQNGRIRQCHTELVAAMRMAEAHPWTGVGLGHYQQWIGTFYRELPNPNVNAIETDTQSGYGILFGTAGFPAGVLFVLMFLAAGVAGVRAWFKSGEREPTALAGAAGILAVLAGMGVSDPLVRGLGWFAVLSLASGWGTREGTPGPRLGVLGLAAAGIGLGLLPAVTVGLGAGRMSPAQPTLERIDARGRRDGGRLAAAGAGAGPAAPANQAQAFPADPDFFQVINAAAAVKRFTPPFDKEKKAGASGPLVLAIPDLKGKPPEGAKPGMKYGGAEFEIDMPRNMTCNVWMRVWWAGSCGNSLYYRHWDGTTIAVGNDGTYHAWHWLKVPETYHFKKGKNRFYVLDREDGIYLDQIVITGDLEYVPQGIEVPEN